MGKSIVVGCRVHGLAAKVRGRQWAKQHFPDT